MVCKDASFAKEDNEHYYLIRYTSFCEQVEVDGVLRDKYVRQTRREIDEGTVREMYEDGFPEPKSKPFTYVDDEYAERTIRCSRTYYEYAKGICENYRMDLRRYKLIREQKQYIGISNREAYQAMVRGSCVCPAVAQNGAQRLRRSLPETLFRGAVHPQSSGCHAAESRRDRAAAGPHSIGRLHSFCSSGTRQTVSVG